VYDLYLKSRSQLDTFTSATNVAAYLQPGAGFRSAIQAAAAADGIEMKNMTPAQETFLLHRCRMLMGRQRFHQQGFYEVAALYDPAIKTALQVLK
jgi:hypothetical protein